MTVTAAQTQYRNEYIKSFEVRQSFFRDTVTTEAVISGNSAVFLVAGSGGATATTRGVNGLIAARQNTNTQYTATLVEQHDLVQHTGFDIFSSQGDQRRIMQQNSMEVINRDIDSVIITELGTGSNSIAAATMSMDHVMTARTQLLNSDIPNDGNIFFAVTPAAEAYLLQMPEFSSADYIAQKPMNSTGKSGNTSNAYKWMGMTIFSHPSLANVGTNSADCLMYHRSAIGHAVNTKGMDVKVGYDDEQDYSYARCSLFHGAQILQDSGIIVVNHDDSAYS